MTKQIRRKLLRSWMLAISFCVLFPLGSCGQSSASDSTPAASDATFAVFLEESSYAYKVLGDNPCRVKRGEEAVFDLQMQGDYVLSGIWRKEERVAAVIENLPSGLTRVRFPNVRYSLTYQPRFERALHSVFYHPNGGQYLDGTNPAKALKVSYSTRNRLRPNTELGTNFLQRDGYILIGWNTESDGSGVAVGLGSRVTVPAQGTTDLYAQWAKHSSASLFSVLPLEEGVRIEGYNGDEEWVVVPSSIEGKAVLDIGPNVFTGNEQVVVFPYSIQNVAEGAFNGSHVRELYFYDNIETITDNSFVNCADFSTIHINAILAPRYGGSNLYSEINFADKYDILILNAGKKKLVAFGGSGTYLSLDTSLLEKNLGGDRVCINMAVNGWFCGAAQMDMMMPYLREDDIFLHCPETSSMFGHMYSTSMLPEVEGFTYNMTRLYSCVESNYDLLSLVDYHHVVDLITGFNVFNNARKSMPETTYYDYKTTIRVDFDLCYNDFAYIDERGNFALPQLSLVGAHEAGEADIVVQYVTDEAAHTRLNAYFDALRNKGVHVFFSTAPINGDTLELRRTHPELFTGANEGEYLYYARPPGIPNPDYESLDAWTHDYERAVARYLDVDVLVPLSETIYQPSDFFEPDYHLCDDAVPIYTGKVLRALLNKGFGKSNA